MSGDDAIQRHMRSLANSIACIMIIWWVMCTLPTVKVGCTFSAIIVLCSRPLPHLTIKSL